MTITKYRNRPAFVAPFGDLMNDIFSNDISRMIGRNELLRNTNSVNIIEREDAFELQLLAPGFAKKDLKLTIENDTLTISAEQKTEELAENERYTRREFGSNAFERSFTLPESVDTDSIKATTTNGILTLNLPKKEKAKPQKREIDIL